MASFLSTIKSNIPVSLKKPFWFIFKAPQRKISSWSLVLDLKGIAFLYFYRFFPQKNNLQPVSICTGIYNRSSSYLETFLASLNEAQNKDSIELSVFDCGSDDIENLEGEIRKKWKGMLVFKSKSVPFSRSYSFNRAVDQSTSAIVFLCDADMSVPRNIVRICNQYTGLKRVWYPIVFSLFRNKPAFISRENGVWMNVSGKGMFACRKDDFMRIGKLDEKFTAWGAEDDELWERFVRNDFCIIRNRQNGLIHHWHPSLDPAKQSLFISVIIPVYNRQQFVAEAIQSILDQSYADFELIVVNDGSTDETETVILSFNDDRIKYISLESNRGNAYARNAGIQAARGKYIVHMDSDDTCPPERLSKQLRYLEKHPEIGILGGSAVFNFGAHQYIRYYARDPGYHRSFQFFKNTLLQATIMMRRELFQKFDIWYKPEEENMEDYSLWYRFSKKKVNMTALRDILLDYRQWEDQLSSPKNIGNRKVHLRHFFQRRLTEIGLSLPEEDFELLHAFMVGRIVIDPDKFGKLTTWLDQIESGNEAKGLYETKYFKAALLFFRLRLLKYRYLERRRVDLFGLGLLRLVFKTGLESVWIFWKNEGRYLASSKASLRL